MASLAVQAAVLVFVFCKINSLFGIHWLKC